MSPTDLHRVDANLLAQDEQKADDEAPSTHSPRTFVAFWACYLGLLIVVIGLLVHHFVAR